MRRQELTEKLARPAHKMLKVGCPSKATKTMRIVARICHQNLLAWALEHVLIALYGSWAVIKPELMGQLQLQTRVKTMTTAPAAPTTAEGAA